MEKDPNKMIKDISGISTTDITFLPKPNLIKSKKFQTLLAKQTQVPIYCNLFKMKISKNNIYYQYSITFNPEIELTNRRAKLFLIKKADDQLREKFGDYVYTGDTLFSPNILSEDIFEAIVKDEKIKIDYSIIIRKTQEIINVNDKSSQYHPSSKILLELIIKEILKLNPNIDFYKNLFVKKNERKLIDGTGFQVEFFPGYTTSIVNTELGLYLNVQIKNKILSNETCLELINQKYDKKKKETVKIVKEFFTERSIRTIYSKRNYRIDDVCFDKNPSNTTFNWNGKNITIYNYFEVSHKIKIKDKTQPLFLQNNYDEKGNLYPIYLVPELCLLAGIDDEMVKDREFMKRLADETKFKPDGNLILHKNINFFKIKNFVYF
jgi:aubergine-like protein